jgi:hypothetical protein
MAFLQSFPVLISWLTLDAAAMRKGPRGGIAEKLLQESPESEIETGNFTA